MMPTKYDALGAAVEGGGQGPEALLACSVPDGDLDVQVMQLHLLNSKINACSRTPAQQG
jgi:hypothetical protein